MFLQAAEPLFEINTYSKNFKAQAYEKKLRFYFLFILVRTTTKSLQFINKPIFWFFTCFGFVLVLLAKQQQQKVNLYTISVYTYAWGLEKHKTRDFWTAFSNINLPEVEVRNVSNFELML
jgi:hypothetical protein